MSEGRRQPERRGAFRHFTSVTTRWMDNDIYGHVNNVQYYSYFDTAVNRYLIENGVLDIHDRDGTVGYVVETGCVYFRGVAFPDTLHLGMRVARLGTSSVRYELAVFRNDEDEASAEGHFVHVYVDRSTGRAAPIPDAVRALLSGIQAPCL